MKVKADILFHLLKISPKSVPSKGDIFKFYFLSDYELPTGITTSSEKADQLRIKNQNEI